MERVLKFVCILLLSSILNTSINIATVYSAENKVIVKVGTNYIDGNNEVKIPISLSDLPENGLSGINFYLQYDEGLTLNGVTNGELITNSKDFTYSKKDDYINLLYSDATGGERPIKTSGVLCYLNFTINNSNKISYSIKRMDSKKEMFIDNSLSNNEATYIEGNVFFKDSLYRVSTDKKWQITFSEEISPSSLINSSVEIKNINGEQIHCNLSVTNGGKTLEISPPTGGYNLYESYTLSIKNTFVSKTGRKLPKEQSVNFYVEK